MKRVDLIMAVEGLGCEFVRHGGKHDWYRNPRHREANEDLARRILRMLSGAGDAQAGS